MRHTVLSLIATAVLAQEDKANYEVFSREFSDISGLNWEPYQVTTSDGWNLTVFRITGDEINPETLPVVAQAGAYGIAADWIGSWVLQLARQGYEVWLTSQRGAEDASTNVNDGVWSLEERWDFTWEEQGVIDIPAMVDKALEISGKSKATVIGYSQGTAMLMNGMVTNLDFYTEKANSVILLAACAICPYYSKGVDWTEYFEWQQVANELGYYNEGAGDASTVDDLAVCSQIHNAEDCEDWGYGEADDEDEDGETPANRAQSIKTTLYWHQTSFEDRYQEYQELNAYLAGERQTDLIDLSKIVGLPVYFIHPEQDKLCYMSYAEQFYEQMGTSDKKFYSVPGDHGMPIAWLPDEAVTEIINLIETGEMDSSKFPDLDWIEAN